MKHKQPKYKRDNKIYFNAIQTMRYLEKKRKRKTKKKNITVSLINTLCFILLIL